MESLCFTVIVFVLIKFNLAQSDDNYAEDKPPRIIETDRALHNGTFVPSFGLYLLGFTIAILGIAVVGLIVYVWHLKRRRYCESIVSVTRKVDNDTYTRQLSAETHILLTPVPSHHDNFKLSEEKITIESPSDTKERIKLDQPHTNRAFLKTPAMPLITPDQMRALLLDKNKCKEFSSLSNLDKIINEGQNNERESKETEKLKVPKSSQIERCSSTPMLDIIDDLPENTANILDNTKSSFSSLRKSVSIEKSGNENGSDLKCISDTNISEPDEIYDKPPNSNKSVLIAEIKDKFSTKNNRSSVDSSACLISDSNGDDVYDNPPSHARPISSIIDFIEEEVYETGPSNRPLTLLENIDQLDNIYDDPKSEQNEKLVSELMKKMNSRDRTSDDEDMELYDKPRIGGREIMFTNADNTAYVMAFAKDTEECLEPSYTNAKELKS